MTRGRQRKPTPSLPPQDEDAETLDEIKDMERKVDFEMDVLCTEINYLLYEADFDKASIHQVQDRLVKAKPKIFGITTELRGVYRTRGSIEKLMTWKLTWIFTSRVLEKFFKKLKTNYKNPQSVQ